jgi:hypothetical protein
MRKAASASANTFLNAILQFLCEQARGWAWHQVYRLGNNVFAISETGNFGKPSLTALATAVTPFAHC